MPSFRTQIVDNDHRTEPKSKTLETYLLPPHNAHKPNFQPTLLRTYSLGDSTSYLSLTSITPESTLYFNSTTTNLRNFTLRLLFEDLTPFLRLTSMILESILYFTPYLLPFGISLRNSALSLSLVVEAFGIRTERRCIFSLAGGLGQVI